MASDKSREKKQIDRIYDSYRGRTTPCHKCASKMIVKRSAAGPLFWGCTKFPHCYGLQKIVNWPELLEQNDDYVKVERKPGATCTSCKTHYPYADASSNFKCWGCENGY